MTRITDEELAEHIARAEEATGACIIYNPEAAKVGLGLILALQELQERREEEKGQCGICAECVPQIGGGSGYDTCEEAQAAESSGDPCPRCGRAADHDTGLHNCTP